ncbi:hypothetical protein C8Q75DRAFT_889300 [Abortiporus biennis]|nr:hypothetical protein C8Q75DRAFT_889300 [Abortiporus biennis]
MAGIKPSLQPDFPPSLLDSTPPSSTNFGELVSQILSQFEKTVFIRWEDYVTALTRQLQSDDILKSYLIIRPFPTFRQQIKYPKFKFIRLVFRASFSMPTPTTHGPPCQAMIVSSQRLRSTLCRKSVISRTDAIYPDIPVYPYTHDFDKLFASSFCFSSRLIFIRGDKASSTPEAPLLVPTLQAQPFGCPWLLFDAPSSISDQKSSPSILGHSTIWLLPPELENSSLRPMGFVLHRHNGPLQTLNPPFHHMTTTLNKYPEPPFIHTISTST